MLWGYNHPLGWHFLCPDERGPNLMSQHTLDKPFWHFVYPNANGTIIPPDLSIISEVFYHCAMGLQPSYWLPFSFSWCRGLIWPPPPSILRLWVLLLSWESLFIGLAFRNMTGSRHGSCALTYWTNILLTNFSAILFHHVPVAQLDPPILGLCVKCSTPVLSGLNHPTDLLLCHFLFSSASGIV